MSVQANDAFVKVAAAGLSRPISIRSIISTDFSLLILQATAVLGGGFDV